MAKKSKQIPPQFLRVPLSFTEGDETFLLIEMLVFALQQTSKKKDHFSVEEAIVFSVDLRLGQIVGQVARHMECTRVEIVELERIALKKITDDLVQLIRLVLKPRKIRSGPEYVTRVAKVASMITAIPSVAYPDMCTFISTYREETAQLPKRLSPPSKRPPGKPRDIA